MTTFVQFDLVGIGWGELTISKGEKFVAFEFSYLEDPIADLFKSLIQLLKKETSSVKIIFPEEPGEHSLLMTMLPNNTLLIEIFWSTEWKILNSTIEYPKKENIYSDSDTLLNFSQKIIAASEALLEKYTLKEYKEKWVVFDFPKELFIELKELIDNN